MNSKTEVTAEEIVEKLTQEAPQGGEVSYDGVTVKGKLDLRHRVIQVAVTLTNCIFTDEVELGYCEFKQFVSFSESRFEKDLDGVKAICRKSLDFSEAVFLGNANFNVLQCEGVGFFRDAQFENEEKDINFGHAIFGILDCDRATFKGGASFNAVQCEESGFFRDAQFEDEGKDINFNHARFGQLDCDR
ncbi:pentapeptide repeat-containing protein, partial [Candidatus Poribacteria bacterium]